MDNLGYLCGAYSVIFAAIFFYAMFIWRRHVQLDRRMRGLEDKLRDIQSEIVARLPQHPRSA